jgi:ABC-type transporter Mla subunit MlaD
MALRKEQAGMAKLLLIKFGFIGLVGLACLGFATGVFGRHEVGSTYGYYAQSFQSWIHSGLPQFIDSTKRGLGL